MKKIFRDKVFIFAIIVIFIFGAFLRLVNPGLDEYKLDELSDLYLSSVNSLRSVSVSDYDSSGGRIHLDLASLPFPFMLTNVWISIFGIFPEKTRILSAAIGSMSMLVFFLILRALKTPNYATLLSFILFAANPNLVMVSRTIRMYSLFIFMTLLSYYFFNKLFFENKISRSGAIAYIIFSFISLSSHYFGFVLFGIQGFVLLLLKRNKLKKWFFCSIFIGLLLSPWVVTVIVPKITNFQGVRDSLDWLKAPNKLSLPIFLARIFFNTSTELMLGSLLPFFGCLFLLFLAVGCCNLKREERVLFLLPPLIVFSTVFLFVYLPFGFSLFNFEYLIVTIPFLLAIIGRSISNLKFIGLFVVILIVIAGFRQDIFTRESVYREILGEIHKADKSPVILFYPNYYTLYLNYYYTEEYHKKVFKSFLFSVEDINNRLYSEEGGWLIFTPVGKSSLSNNISIFASRDQSRVNTFSKGAISVIHIIPK